MYGYNVMHNLVLWNLVVVFPPHDVLVTLP